MTQEKFIELLNSKILILDGATGTELQKLGMPQGVCPEQWVIENPQILHQVQQAYVAAGSDVVYSCTFGANRMKLEEFGLQDKVYEMNKRLAEISREAVGDSILVAGDIAPTGQFVEPFGDVPFETVVDVYKEQAQGLLDGGIDYFIIETMIDIQEMRAALIAIREICDLPVVCSMTYSEDGYTLTGTEPVAALVTLQSLGASAVGCNCSTGPNEMLQIIKKLKPYATVPLVAKPNAGLPKLIDGKTVFDMSPEEFASYVPQFIEAGVNIFGGCCGTSPEYIGCASKKVAGVSPVPVQRKSISALSSARSALLLEQGNPLAVIGERINPTGKKQFQEELRAGRTSMIKKFAAEQERSGAAVLDVNMGMSGIDEQEMMLTSVRLLSSATALPLCIDSSDPAVIESALRLYPGRALLNSISAEKVKQPLLETAAKYGAMFILLPLTDEEIPATCEGRQKVVKEIYASAQKHGLTKEDIVIDAIVMTVSSDQRAALEALRFVRWCSSEFGAHTTMGLSNVSFGLPERKWVNTAFLAMAMYNGLSMAIANPNEPVLMNLKLASDVLTCADKGSKTYIANIVGDGSSAEVKKEKKKDSESIFDAVVDGDRELTLELVKKALAENIPSQTIIDEYLIPGINKVGDLYEQKKYFLPQLIAGADAMKDAFAYLEQFLLEDEGEQAERTKVILATVKGDIHDIGKNIVGIMLKNYGFDVIDLGKDVPAETIIDTAVKENVRIIGLSALMTTTMVEMKEVIQMARDKKIDAQFMIGGAVITQEYADEIGADGYAKDSIESVRLAKKFSGIE